MKSTLSRTALTAALTTIVSFAGCGGPATEPAAPAGPGKPEAVDCSQSNIQLVYAGRSYRLTATCYDYDELKLAQGELLYGPDKGSPDIHMWGCAEGVMVSLFGHAPTVPGSLELPILKLKMPGDPDERPSDSATIRVTSMGAPGDMIAGTFEGTMSPKLNEPAVPVHGTMCVKRKPDRNRP